MSEPLSDEKLRSYIDVRPKIHEPWSAHLVDQLLDKADAMWARLRELESENARLAQEVIDARRTIAEMLWQLGLREPALTWFHVTHATMVELPAKATITVHDDADGRLIRLAGVVPGDHP